MECQCCGAANDSRRTQIIIDPKWPLSRCSCSFVFLEAAPEYRAVATEYAWEKTSAAESRRRAQHWLGRLEQATRWRTQFGHALDFWRRQRTAGHSGNVLDIGCGGSCRVPPGPTPFGIEISPALAALASADFEKRGGRVVEAPALFGLDQFPDGFFRAILMRSYLEHEKAAFDVLAKAARKLERDGKIYVRVPDFASVNRRVMRSHWCGYRFPDHVNYFTGKTLKALADRAGLKYRRMNRLSLLDDNIIAELSAY